MLPFDPSKLDPKLLAELTQIVQQLPPDQIMRMQTLMHNMMAGIDVSREMQEFEQNLPMDFRAKMAQFMYANPDLAKMGSQATSSSQTTSPIQNAQSAEPVTDVDSARLTILQAVSNGTITPEHALTILFPTS